MQIVLYRDEIDSPAGKPRAPQFVQRVASHDEGANAGRISKDLVEGQRDILRGVLAQTEWVAREKRRRIEQDVEAATLRVVDQRQRVLHAREVGLRRKREHLRAGRCGSGEVECRT